MKRGDVVIATGPGFGKKPRPFVVMQADEYDVLPTLILLPITTGLADPPVKAAGRAGTGWREWFAAVVGSGD